METQLIYWVAGKLIEGSYLNGVIKDAPTVDITHPESDPKNRYGAFRFGGGWWHIPKEEFPKEFLVHLLLLGVS